MGYRKSYRRRGRGGRGKFKRHGKPMKFYKASRGGTRL